MGREEAAGLGVVVDQGAEGARWRTAQVVQPLAGEEAGEERWTRAVEARAEEHWMQASEARGEAQAERWKRAEAVVEELLLRAAVVVLVAQMR